MENQLPNKKLIDDNGVLLKTPGMLRHERDEEARKNVVEATGEKSGEGLLDRSKMVEARKTRLEGEIAEAGEKPKEGVLDRAKIAEQRKIADEAKIKEIKGTIEERLSAVEEKVGVDETDQAFSKEGLLNRNLGRKREGPVN